MHDREESVCHADGRRAFVAPATPDVRLAPEQGPQITASRKSGDDASTARDEQGRVVPTMWR